jgi:hypothetical protein
MILYQKINDISNVCLKLGPKTSLFKTIDWDGLQINQFMMICEEFLAFNEEQSYIGTGVVQGEEPPPPPPLKKSSPLPPRKLFFGNIILFTT